MRWWSRDREPEPEPVRATAPADPGWRAHPAVQRTVAPIPSVAGVTTFASGLTTWRDPRFLAPLAHGVDATAPAGVVHGLVEPAAPVAAPLPVPAMPVATAPVQRAAGPDRPPVATWLLPAQDPVPAGPDLLAGSTVDLPVLQVPALAGSGTGAPPLTSPGTVGTHPLDGGAPTVGAGTPSVGLAAVQRDLAQPDRSAAAAEPARPAAPAVQRAGDVAAVPLPAVALARPVPTPAPVAERAAAAASLSLPTVAAPEAAVGAGEDAPPGPYAVQRSVDPTALPVPSHAGDLAAGTSSQDATAGPAGPAALPLLGAGAAPTAVPSPSATLQRSTSGPESAPQVPPPTAAPLATSGSTPTRGEPASDVVSVRPGPDDPVRSTDQAGPVVARAAAPDLDAAVQPSSGPEVGLVSRVGTSDTRQAAAADDVLTQSGPGQRPLLGAALPEPATGGAEPSEAPEPAVGTGAGLPTVGRPAVDGGPVDPGPTTTMAPSVVGAPDAFAPAPDATSNAGDRAGQDPPGEPEPGGPGTAEAPLVSRSTETPLLVVPTTTHPLLDLPVDDAERPPAGALPLLATPVREPGSWAGTGGPAAVPAGQVPTDRSSPPALQRSTVGATPATLQAATRAAVPATENGRSTAGRLHDMTPGAPARPGLGAPLDHLPPSVQLTSADGPPSPSLPRVTPLLGGPHQDAPAAAAPTGAPAHDALAPGPLAPGPLATGSLATGPLATGSLAPGPLAPGPLAPGPLAPGPLATGSLATEPLAPGSSGGPVQRTTALGQPVQRTSLVPGDAAAVPSSGLPRLAPLLGSPLPPAPTVAGPAGPDHVQRLADLRAPGEPAGQHLDQAAGAFPVAQRDPASPAAPAAHPAAAAHPAPEAYAGPDPAGAALAAGVAQRDADGSVVFPAAPAVQRLPEPEVQRAAAGPPATAPPDVEELARRLFDPLCAHLKAELRLDRERAGLVTDLRR